MNLIIIITCNFISGAAIAHFMQDVLPDFWDHVFKTKDTYEADEQQTIWYQYEKIIYGVVILFGYVFMCLLLYAFAYGRIKKLLNKIK